MELQIQVTFGQNLTGKTFAPNLGLDSILPCGEVLLALLLPLSLQRELRNYEENQSISN